MNMTTIEYLNLPLRTNNYNNSIFDSDDEDYYYSDSESSDENHTTVWKRSLQTQRTGYTLYRKVTHKLWRTWILMARTAIPNYRYRRLTNSKRSCCLILFKKHHLLPMATSPRKKQRTKRDTSRFKTRDNVNMEEFFATRTIRPVINLDDEGGSEPDYDDDMGLDLSGLDRFSDDEDIKKKVVNRSSKAARLLDLSEEDTLIHMQQPLMPMEIPKEETALSEL